jgi:chloramphenicol-sensitive protein RarD
VAGQPNADKGRADQQLSGLLYGLLAYGIWGLFPLYWPLMQPAGAPEIVAHRSLWSLVFLAAVVTFTRGWAAVRRTFAQPKTRWLLLLAAALVATNWTGYIYAVNHGHVLEASLGYFINPLVSVVIGVVILSERLRAAQWVAVGLGAAAVVIITVAYGHPPWTALVLASSFAVYGLVKKVADVPAVASLTVETTFMAPVALALLLVLAATGDGHFGREAGQSLLFAGAGIVTSLPLLAFGAAAIRIPLSNLGLLQYLTPVMQFLLGLLVFGEHLDPVGWLGFGLIWLALVVFSISAFRAARSTHQNLTPASTSS